MGPYAFFVVGSYAVTALVVAALILRAVLDHRAQVRALAEFEARGVTRRSATAPRTIGPAAADRETSVRAVGPGAAEPKTP
jgi:heme exporter protein D